MRNLGLILLAFSVALSGCAYKGKLKTPTQIARDKEEKKRQAERDARQAEKAKAIEARQAEEDKKLKESGGR